MVSLFFLHLLSSVVGEGNPQRCLTVPETPLFWDWAQIPSLCPGSRKQQFSPLQCGSKTPKAFETYVGADSLSPPPSLLLNPPPRTPQAFLASLPTFCFSSCHHTEPTR